MKTTNKKLHLELLRFLAILFVIFNHTGTHGYLYFTTVEGSALYPLFFFLSMLCKLAVPLFWMVSGALLIDRNESLKQLYLRRILRMAIVLLLFSFLYYLNSARFNPGFRFSPVYFLTQVYSTKYAPAFWFLYAYLGMLVILPLIRAMAKNLTNREFMYFFAAMLIIRGILPVAEYVYSHGEMTIEPNFLNNFLSYDMVYFLMGYFLENRIFVQKLNYKTALLLIAGGLAAMLVMGFGTQLFLNDGGSMTDAAAENFYPGLLLVPSAALYYLMRLVFRDKRTDNFGARLIVFLGGVSFGVMLLEHFLRLELEGVLSAMLGIMPEFIACLLWTALIYLCGAAITFVLKHIPGLKKIL